MPLYVGDYLADTLDLTTEQTGCYLMLLMVTWMRPDGALPNDLKSLRRALSACTADMHGNRFNKLVPPLLERFFTLGADNKFRQKRLTSELEKSKKFSEKQRENVEKRWSKASENNGLLDANVIPARALHSQSHTQSQKEERKEPIQAKILSVVRGGSSD